MSPCRIIELSETSDVLFHVRCLVINSADFASVIILCLCVALISIAQEGLGLEHPRVAAYFIRRGGILAASQRYR